MIELALADARAWCHGHIIDDRPALAHALQVATTLDAHVSCAPPLVCAALLHDSPLFAPADIDLNAFLTDRYGPEVTRIIRALEAQHEALDSADPPVLVDDQPVLLASTADKIVALSSLLRRARASGDVDAFFRARGPLLRLLPYFRAYQQAGAPLVPQRMAAKLRSVIERIDQATELARRG